MVMFESCRKHTHRAGGQPSESDETSLYTVSLRCRSLPMDSHTVQFSQNIDHQQISG